MKKKRTFLSVLVVLSMLFLVVFAPSVRADNPVTQNEAERLYELTELRERNSETYQRSDGTRECVVYASDRYFPDASGSLVPIDHTVVETTHENKGTRYRFTNAASNMKVYFSDERMPSVLLTSGKDSLSFSAVGADRVNAKAGASRREIGGVSLGGKHTIEYRNAFPGTDLLYAVQNGMVKEVLILNDETASSSFLFRFDKGDYTVQIGEDGAVHFLNAKGESVFQLGTLFAVDSGGAYTEELTYAIEEESETAVTVRFSLSEAWLKAPGRSFPVLIDPTLIISGNLNTFDAFVSSRYPNTNYYSQGFIRTGKDTDFYVRRTYIKFDIPSWIRPGSVTSAALRIEKYSGAAPSIKAYRVTGSWTSQDVTWNNKPAYTTTGASPTATQYYQNWCNMPVHSIVQGWVNETYTNYGFLIKDATESNTNQWTTYYSSDAPFPHRPELHIVYNEKQYLTYGSAGNYIYVKPYSYSGIWQTALDQSRNNWNTSSAPIYFYTSSNSNNEIGFIPEDNLVYGRMIPLELSGSTLVKFRIVLNSEAITRDAAPGCLGNFIQSIFVHELGHTIWLADNPVTPSNSTMKYSRDRNSMTNPSPYDISNVDAKY